MSNNPEYSRMYYRTHIKKIRARKKAWYLKNRERVLAKQIKYNRENAARIRATRAGQKPVRQSVRDVSTADNSGARDTAPKRRSKKPAAGQHGDAVQSVSQPDTLSSLEPLDVRYPDPAPGLVSKPLSSPEIKESIPDVSAE